jgi:hypothetical protein
MGTADRGEYRQAAGAATLMITLMACRRRLLPMLKMLGLLGALLLVVGTCFAEDPWPDQYSATTGPDAQKEFAALSENGRAAYKRALIACSLYIDHYYDPNYKRQCQTLYESFEVEFGSRFIGLLFRNAIISTHLMVINSELGVSQARRELDGDNDFAKASIAALEKIYRETNDRQVTH